MGTVFELPTMPVGPAEQPVKSATARSRSPEPDVPTASAADPGRFALPTRGADVGPLLAGEQRTSLDTLVQDVAQSCYTVLVPILIFLSDFRCMRAATIWLSTLPPCQRTLSQSPADGDGRPGARKAITLGATNSSRSAS